MGGGLCGRAESDGEIGMNKALFDYIFCIYNAEWSVGRITPTGTIFAKIF